METKKGVPASIRLFIQTAEGAQSTSEMSPFEAARHMFPDLRHPIAGMVTSYRSTEMALHATLFFLPRGNQLASQAVLGIGNGRVDKDSEYVRSHLIRSWSM